MGGLRVADAVFLSASVPDPKRGPEYARTANTVAITSAVSALIHVTLGRRPLVWGGHPAITPMIYIVAKEMGVDYGKWVHLYQSRFFKDSFPEDNKLFRNTTYTSEVHDDRDKSLLNMRIQMFTENKFTAGVFVGGMAGIIDEFELFHQLQPEAVVVPVVSTGGATIEVAQRLDDIDSDLLDNLDYVQLFHKYLGISVCEERYRQPKDQPIEVKERYWTPSAISPSRR